MNKTQYNVFNIEELLTQLDTVSTRCPIIQEFFTTFTFSKILSKKEDSVNSAFVFKKTISDDETKSLIISSLNKLHPQHLEKTISAIRAIHFKSLDELNELVSQCIYKIKKDGEQIKPLVATLCNELLMTYFLTVKGEPIYFRKLLLTAIKDDYMINTNYANNWTREKGDGSMVLIGILYNANIIEDLVMKSIINDFKMRIVYKEDEKITYYDIVEKAIHQLTCLVSTIVLNDRSIVMYEDLDIWLEDQIKLYEKKTYISKRIRLVCKNCIDSIRKYAK